MAPQGCFQHGKRLLQSIVDGEFCPEMDRVAERITIH